MDRQGVLARAVVKKTSLHRPVPQRLKETHVYGFPREQVESTFQDGLRTDTRECSGLAQSEPPAMSPPYLGPSLVTVQLFKGVFYKPEDFETGFASPNQPQHITQDQANGISQLSLTNTQMDSTHPQSCTATALSLPSTSSYHNHQNVILNSDSQPVANGLPSKRKICESVKEFEDDSVEWLDYAHQESSPPVKKPKYGTIRLCNAQPMVAKQSQRQPAEDGQQKELYKQDGQVITLVLQCPEWSCSQMFTTNQHTTAVDQLNHHLKVVHSIDLHRCMVLYCAESFPNSYALGQHLKHFHAGIKEWHCSKCPKQFISYSILSHHKMLHHQLGQFECSFSACTFTAECKAKVVSHYGNHHRVKPELVCQAKAGCVYRTTNSSVLKEHERVHLGIKPYRCDWHDCHHSCVSLSGAIRHIKRVHFKPKTSSSDEVALYGNPKVYISVDHSLL